MREAFHRLMCTQVPGDLVKIQILILALDPRFGMSGKLLSNAAMMLSVAHTEEHHIRALSVLLVETTGL